MNRMQFKADDNYDDFLPNLPTFANLCQPSMPPVSSSLPNQPRPLRRERLISPPGRRGQPPGKTGEHAICEFHDADGGLTGGSAVTVSMGSWSQS